jgi:hypothetical protein
MLFSACGPGHFFLARNLHWVLVGLELFEEMAIWSNTLSHMVMHSKVSSIIPKLCFLQLKGPSVTHMQTFHHSNKNLFCLMLRRLVPPGLP